MKNTVVEMKIHYKESTVNENDREEWISELEE